MARVPVRLTSEQRATGLRLAVALAEFAVALNETYPYPPDVHHRALEQAARQLLDTLKPKRLVKRKRR